MAHGGNVIQELTADHREVDALFAQIEALPAADPQRRELANRLTMELVRHSVTEEEYLYPTVRRYVDDGTTSPTRRSPSTPRSSACSRN